VRGFFFDPHYAKHLPLTRGTSISEKFLAYNHRHDGQNSHTRFPLFDMPP
jgi:hypothetical protein